MAILDVHNLIGKLKEFPADEGARFYCAQNKKYYYVVFVCFSIATNIIVIENPSNTELYNMTYKDLSDELTKIFLDHLPSKIRIICLDTKSKFEFIQ